MRPFIFAFLALALAVLIARCQNDTGTRAAISFLIHTNGVSFHEKGGLSMAVGRKGGVKGGPARARSLTKEERRAISQKAAHIRWAKEKKERRIAAGVEWGNPKDQS